MSNIEGNKKYVWYVTYGSNMLRERFMVYINGGRFRGKGKGQGNWKYKPCNNNSPPLADKLFPIPYELYYGQKSKTWSYVDIASKETGSEKRICPGVAFIDADRSDTGTTLGRAYLITEEQFFHIQEQEGSEWYKCVVEMGKDAGGIPYKTFTGTRRYDYNAPHENYTNIMFEGICETYYPHLTYSRFHRLMGEAIKHLGKPYVRSKHDERGKGPNAFDCVWFVIHVFNESGIYYVKDKHLYKPPYNEHPYQFPGLAKYKFESWLENFNTVEITEPMCEGDVLIFCDKDDKTIIGHVGIYIGHNMMIHANNPYVCIDDINKYGLLNRLMAIGRSPV